MLGSHPAAVAVFRMIVSVNLDCVGRRAFLPFSRPARCSRQCVMKQSSVPTTCVIVSYWTGHSMRNLLRLLRQMGSVDAGSPFDTIVVCNGGDVRPLSLPESCGSVKARVLNRENSGYNIGAWEAGWRAAGPYECFLFLQDECFLKRPHWLSEFEFRMDHDSGIGLLGETMMWDQMSWRFIRTATDRDLGSSVWSPGDQTHPLEQYETFLDARGIPKGDVGTHLQSLVLFTRRTILEEVGGFPLGKTYREAVACEIGISRLIASRGYRLARIHDAAFRYIGHHQWTRRDRLYRKARGILAAWARKAGLKRP